MQSSAAMSNRSGPAALGVPAIAFCNSASRSAGKPAMLAALCSAAALAKFHQTRAALFHRNPHAFKRVKTLAAGLPGNEISIPPLPVLWRTVAPLALGTLGNSRTAAGTLAALADTGGALGTGGAAGLTPRT